MLVLDLLPLVQLGSIFGALATILTALFTRFFPWIRAKTQSRSLYTFCKQFTRAHLERAMRYYVPPLCQNVDPAGSEEPRKLLGVRQDLFAALDEHLAHPTEFRYVFLLADSGMGKTSASINYCGKYIRRWRRHYDVTLIVLGKPETDRLIEEVEDKEDTILFLDAFDEDTLAAVDCDERLRTLVNATQEFHRVIITCRTQFFSSEKEIPVRTGVIKVEARAAGEPAEYLFHKIYLSPFSDQQVQAYLKRKYPLWQIRKRRAAFNLVEKIPNLCVRPMLLTHIDDLLLAKKGSSFTFELYEDMIEAWLTREQGFVSDKMALRKFSALLAVDIYCGRLGRGGEHMPKGDLYQLARYWQIPLDDWILTSRSLLNRDTEGNYKFSHRSIMEYLFLEGIDMGGQLPDFTLTDQMWDFMWEILEFNLSSARMTRKNLIRSLLKAGAFDNQLANSLREFKMSVIDGQTALRRVVCSIGAIAAINREVAMLGIFEIRWIRAGVSELISRQMVFSQDGELTLASGAYNDPFVLACQRRTSNFQDRFPVVVEIAEDNVLVWPTSDKQCFLLKGSRELVGRVYRMLGN